MLSVMSNLTCASAAISPSVQNRWRTSSAAAAEIESGVRRLS
jgi:hypothetical protein